MKILMLCDFFNESLEYQENLLVKYYAKHGHQVTVVTSTHESVFDYYADRHDNSTPERRYTHGGARIIKLPYSYNILNRLRAFTPISSILVDEAPDLIFVHDIMLNLPECVRYVKRHPACRMILDYHADYSNSGKNALSLRVLHGLIRKWFLDRARPYLSRIFPIVPASATFLHEVYGVPHADMELLPLGADTDLGRKVRASGARARLRRAYGIGDDEIVVFTGGKLDPLKRTEALIEAFRSLPERMHLIVVGDSAPSEADYKDMLLRTAAGAPNVHFTGWLDAEAIYAHLDLADMAVFPASQSILWQQAISMGLTLVVGDRTAVSNIQQDVSYLNEYGNVLILDPDRQMVDELRRHIARLASDAALRRTMSQGAMLATQRLLNWDTLIERTLRFNLESPALSTDQEIRA